jgi:sn-glycerol 3-phosphate transport system ATP-binding protein
VPARVDFVEPLGSHVLVTAVVEETRVIVQAPAGLVLESGTRIGLSPQLERTYFFDAETGDARRSRERISL